MEIFTLLNLITLALASHASLLQAQENPALVSQEDTFKQLCINEYKAKLEHENCISPNTEADLFERYLELMDSRILLGSQLDIHFCPPELVGGVINQQDYRKKQLAYDQKCQAEVRAATLCSKFTEAGQLASEHATFFRVLLKRRQVACLEYKNAVKSRDTYAKNHSILRPCDAELRRNSTKLAEAEFDQWFELFKPENAQHNHHKDSSTRVADTKNHDEKSSKSKIKLGLFSCFRKPEVKS